jgi:2-oxo-3-hexenedioate decarboxylase
MNSKIMESLAERIDTAAKQVSPITQLTLAQPFDLQSAYAIQRLSVARRTDRGEKTIGIKLGFTSRAKMLQMGVSSLIWGWLTDAMLEDEGGELRLGDYIHPRAEPEVCFLTRKAIDRPLTALEAVDYLEAVAPALEIIDSRYQDFKFSLEDVVADNCSSAGLVVGGWSRRFDALDNAGVIVRFDGRVVQAGSTAAILGNPLRSVVLASNLLAANEIVLPAGSLIMAGAATAAQALTPGAFVECQIGRDGPGSLGRVAFNVAANKVTA